MSHVASPYCLAPLERQIHYYPLEPSAFPTLALQTASNNRTDRLTPTCLASFAVYQGLIPWAWIEASTKGAVLLFAAAEIQDVAMTAGVGPAAAGLLGGMGGGVAQAYATVGTSSLSFFKRLG